MKVLFPRAGQLYQPISLHEDSQSSKLKAHGTLCQTTNIMSSFIMQDSKGQSLSPDQIEQRDYPNRSSQVETLTEIQRELIDSIGNRQLANRLHKRTLKIYKREERLEAIEFYRTHVHVNPQTGEECNLSIATASEALYISECTLKTWTDEERKIISMRQGARRDDGKRYTTVPTPERLKTGDYSFLRLTPQQLSIRNWIKGKDLYKVFLGFI